jgi:dephospho-CoA kinase
MKRASGRHAARVPRIALTGGIASGKTTVAKLFEALGAKTIDTDRIARELVMPPSSVLDGIAARFGAGIVKPDGMLDRAQLRRVVFADARARADLEAIMHPAIHDEVERQSRELGGPYQLVAIPLLVETGTADRHDRVLLVDASPALQRLRLKKRDGIDSDAADRMIAAQATRDSRRAIAHDIIENDGDIAHLAHQVQALHQVYLALGSPGDDS